jgi:lycopene cyclase domain-containing protein
MMYSYAAMSIILLISVFVIVYYSSLSWPRKKTTLITFAILLPAMLIFNGYLTSLPIVIYNKNLILGIKIGSIPIEDFSYLIASVILVPAIFNYFKNDK